MLYNELLGMVATAILLFSMVCSCRNRRSFLVMRITNAVAAVLFIIYSIMLNAYSSIVSNIVILVIDIYHIYWCLKSGE